MHVLICIYKNDHMLSFHYLPQENGIMLNSYRELGGENMYWICQFSFVSSIVPLVIINESSNN